MRVVEQGSGLRAQGSAEAVCPAFSCSGPVSAFVDRRGVRLPARAGLVDGLHAGAPHVGEATREFFAIRPSRGPADSVSAQDPHRQEGGLRRLSRERRQGPDRRHPERQDLHDLPQPDRDRQAADQAGDRAIRTRGSRSRGSASTASRARRTCASTTRRTSAPASTARPVTATSPTQTVAERVVDHNMGFCVNCHKQKNASNDCSDVSLTGHGPRRLHQADGDYRHQRHAGELRQSGAPAHSLRARRRPRAGRRGVEAERVPDVRGRLRRERPRHGRRRRDDAQRPGRRREDGAWRRSSRATPKDPISQGGLCARGQASIQVTYHPDRLTHPMKRTGARGAGEFKEITWDEAIAELTGAARRARRGRRSEVARVPDAPAPRPPARRWPASSSKGFGAPAPITYELFADDVLRRANAISFGHEQLPTIDLARSRFAISFGADFLGTWNSPVAQSAAYGAMRQGRPGVRGAFVQVESRMSLTGASADEWVPVKPGTEGVLALGLAHVILGEQAGRPTPARRRRNRRLVRRACRTTRRRRSSRSPASRRRRSSGSRTRSSSSSRRSRSSAARRSRTPTACSTRWRSTR